jgi:hypothetical protein
MPYFIELQKQNMVEPFVCYVSQHRPAGRREWLMSIANASGRLVAEVR